MRHLPKPNVCGLDEAGRGALAGPIIIAGVVFPARFTFAEAAPSVVARDSKLLSTRQREALYGVVMASAVAVAVEVIGAREIDARGINWANTEGFRRLVQRLEATRYIVDGRWDLGELGARAPRVSCQVRADETIAATLAAGVVAKVHRDLLMRELDEAWPMYGWATNTGHGTLAHIEALRMFGPSPEHRKQFVATALDGRRRRRAAGPAA